MPAGYARHLFFFFSVGSLSLSLSLPICFSLSCRSNVIVFGYSSFPLSRLLVSCAKAPLTLGRASRSPRYYDVTVPSFTLSASRVIRAFFTILLFTIPFFTSFLLTLLSHPFPSTVYFFSSAAGRVIFFFSKLLGDTAPLSTRSRSVTGNDPSRSNRILVEHLVSTIWYPRSCLPGEVQRRSGVLLKLIFLAVARLVLLFLFHTTSVHFMSVRSCVLDAEVHRLLLFRPERSQERQTLVIRDLYRTRSRTSVSFGVLAVDLAALSILLASLRR